MDDSRLQNAMAAASVESGKAMGSAMKQDSKDEGTIELFKLNQVWYKMPPTLSLVSKRCITRCNFQQVGYGGVGQALYQQTASCIFNTGEFHVNGKTSYLVIQAGIDKSRSDLNGTTGIFNTTLLAEPLASKAKLSTHALLGQGGIMNIFEEITFISASGTECDRQQNKGLQVSHVQRNRYPLDWYDTAGELQGVPGGSYQDCYDSKGWPGWTVTGTGAIYSPWLMPIRNQGTQDWSAQIIDTLAGIGNTNVARYDLYPSTRFDNVKFDGRRATGSFDVSFDSSSVAQPTATGANLPPVGGVHWVAEEAFYFVVPMSELLGLFKPYMDALIPSQVLAGARLEIRFKNMIEALIATGPSFAGNTVASNANMSNNTNAITNAGTFLNAMQIYNIYFLLDSYQLNEGTLRRLNEAAASNDGLMLMYDTWDWTQTQPSGLSFEAQVSQARSRILRSFCVIRDSLCRTDPFANSLASEAIINRKNASNRFYDFGDNTQFPSATTTNSQQLLVNNYQAVLGSLYFPQQPLGTAEEYCMNSYYMWCRSTQDLNENNAVSWTDFVGANGYNMYNQTANAQIGANTAIAPVATLNTTTYATPTLWTDGHPIGAPTAGTFSPDVRSSSSSTAMWAINYGSATFGFVAERSQLLQLSGLPISNARLLRHRFNLNYDPFSKTFRVVDAFTEYTRALKVFLGGRCVVRE